MVIVALLPLLFTIEPVEDGNVRVPPEKLTTALFRGGRTLFFEVLGLTFVPDPTVTTRLGVEAAMRRPTGVTSLLIEASVLSMAFLATAFS
jgi:hypothetical protein